MQLFYNARLSKETNQIVFDKAESRHIIRVLRKKEHDILHITNGKGELFIAEITIGNDKKCVAKVIDVEQKQKLWNYYLHIAIAPTKSNDRFEWFLEKATEIGIDEITPIICQNSERKVVKIERIQKIIQSAMKQSLNFFLPKLNSPMEFTDFVQHNSSGIMCIAHCKDDKNRALKSLMPSQEKITILIGPEGDFSIKEIERAVLKKWIPISLSNSRLRTETAALVAVHSVSLMHQ